MSDGKDREPATFRIRNWQHFQHYKDRNPPWIKLHFELLTSRDWVMLDDASRVLAIASMLIASRNDGEIPNDGKYMCRVAYLQQCNFKPLIDVGFLEVASTRKRLQAVARPETETETETETEAETDAHARKRARAAIVLPEWLDVLSWDRWQKHRREIGKPLKPTAIEAQWRKLEKYLADGYAPADVIEHSIACGYQGLFPPKKPNGKGAHHATSYETAHERLRRANGGDHPGEDAPRAESESDGAVVDQDGRLLRS